MDIGYRHLSKGNWNFSLKFEMIENYIKKQDCYLFKSMGSNSSFYLCKLKETQIYTGITKQTDRSNDLRTGSFTVTINL